MRPPFKHSHSASLLDAPQQRKAGQGLQPMLTHPPFGKRVSSDSIGEEDESGPCSQSAIDFSRLRKQSDIGTLVKSESGTHLFLGDEMLPTKYTIGVPPKSSSSSNARIIRQTSVAESTPPVSPQSRYSCASSHGDSALTDSAFSASREGSVTSGEPSTPDDFPEKTLTWDPDPAPPHAWHWLPHSNR